MLHTSPKIDFTK